MEQKNNGTIIVFNEVNIKLIVKIYIFFVVLVLGLKNYIISNIIKVKILFVMRAITAAKHKITLLYTCL